MLGPVYLVGFAGSGLLGQVCWVRFSGSGWLGQVCWVRFAGSGLLSQVCLVMFTGLGFTGFGVRGVGRRLGLVSWGLLVGIYWVSLVRLVLWIISLTY